MASIRSGKVRASLILNKLAANRRNRLFQGLQEFGRLIKTAYLAEYLRSEDLRRRVLLGLNKGESLNALARKLFYGGQGEMRDRTYEDQLNAASSLNLLLAAIVVWNTVHIQACVRRLRADGHPVEEEDLKHLSPLRVSARGGNFHLLNSLYAKAEIQGGLAYDFSKIVTAPQCSR